MAQHPEVTLNEHVRTLWESAQAGTPSTDGDPISRTSALFPPLPIYETHSSPRSIRVLLFRAVAYVLSCGFLLMIVLGLALDASRKLWHSIRTGAFLADPRATRPFFEEELKRAQERAAAEKEWLAQKQKKKQHGTPALEKGLDEVAADVFIPTAGGPDPLSIDVRHYARRVGLDMETFEVQTDDGFIIELWHIFNPREYQRRVPTSRSGKSEDPFEQAFEAHGLAQPYAEGNKRYPVLMMHGLLQSAGAFCSNDDDSLAFYLAKSGYDVWLGNNRCGFEPKHATLQYEDPQMWAWNIRHMGVFDLPALVTKVLAETGFPKLALVAHSQGTTQTLVALAKDQRPDIGEKISVFCALAPAAYAGPLIGKVYFKFMQSVSPTIFRLIFGVHAFLPVMMLAHKLLPARFYSWTGYHVFSFLFQWSDTRWDRGLRDRMFQCAPVYVSAESMRWWLGADCFAKHRCILATREEGHAEDMEDEEDDELIHRLYTERGPEEPARRKLQRNVSWYQTQVVTRRQQETQRVKFAWYDERFPPLALWVCGADDLVDGRRLLRRFDRGREPHVQVVHKKIIEGYEHLDVIWAMDAIEKVGKEVREIIWRTVDINEQRRCRTPVGCSQPLEEDPPADDEVPMLNSGGRARMASISSAVRSLGPSGRPRSGTAHSRLQGSISSKPLLGVHSRPRSGTATSRLQSTQETFFDRSHEQQGEHDHLMAEEMEYGYYGAQHRASFGSIESTSEKNGHP